MAQTVDFIIYDKRTGAIVHSVKCREERVAKLSASLIQRNYRHFGRIEGVNADGRTQIVDLATLTVIAKPEGFDGPRALDRIAQDYAFQRRAAFDAEGLDVFTLFDAVEKAILDGDLTKLTELREKRAAIKARHPKPR